MKKFIPILIVFTLLFATVMSSTIAQAQADTKISLKEAIEIAKTKLGISGSGYDFTSSYSEYGNYKVWNLTWNSTTKGTISVSVNANTGEIVSYSTWTPASEPYKPVIPKYTREEAKKAAIEFLQKITPEKFKQTEEWTSSPYSTNSYYDPNYNFSFARIVNGIVFPYNLLSVSVDKNTLKISFYTQTWDELSFPKPENIITKEEAIKIFKEKIGLTLQYALIPPQLEKESYKTLLVYGVYQNAPIDAFTGEVKKPLYYYPMPGGRTAPAGEKDMQLTPEEKKEIEASEKYISKDKALEIAKNSLPFSLEGYKLDSASLYTDTYYAPAKNPTWSFYWNLQKDNKYFYVNASVDAVTGELTYFSKTVSDIEDKDKQPKYTSKELREIAEKYLERIIPEKFKNTKYFNETSNPDYSPNLYTFTYLRTANGILAPFNSITITLNPYTGEITSYYLNWTNVNFTPAENVITLDEAYKILLDNYEMKLNYILDYDYKSPDALPKVKLVYQLDFYGYIDAKTGTLLDGMGRPIVKESKVTFTDIEGNWAEKDIKILAEYGIIEVEGDKYYPDKEITQKDFIKMLVKTVQPPYYDPMPKSSKDYETYYTIAVSKKIIKPEEKNPDSPVTRLETAKMLVNALQAGYIAEIPNIFNVDFKDKNTIPKNMIGYVAIISGLNIMKGSEGYFYPERPLTRAEAAAVLVRYLQVNK
ncbi:YcdB/YcdC domain-containing protein [Caldanaerobacter sp.]|uniref:YcdB/YcdC domain-containing protein n=1 Tax=Caldanaerobacter sp. TaxID=2930036 RepID=UPI003C711DA2